MARTICKLMAVDAPKITIIILFSRKYEYNLRPFRCKKKFNEHKVFVHLCLKNK